MNTTPQERLALGALALLLAAGGVARVVRGGPAPAEWGGTPGSERSASALLAAVDSGASRAEARARPLAPGERLDPNRASADDLARLPGVGEALAERIVERRQEHGRFRSLADLDSVSGVGPAMLRRMAPHLTLRAGPAPTRSAAPPRRHAPSAAPTALDLNRASAAELEALQGVGPSLAARIVEWRERNGRFRSVGQLEQVSGIGSAKLAQIRGSVRVTP